jgi:hypothetical protein
MIAVGLGPLTVVGSPFMAVSVMEIPIEATAPDASVCTHARAEPWPKLTVGPYVRADASGDVLLLQATTIPSDTLATPAMVPKRAFFMMSTLETWEESESFYLL